MSLYRYRATASVRAVEPGVLSCSAARPRRNAWRFLSTATPCTRIAASIASGGSGSAPVWKPAPTRKTLANWSSPNSPRTIWRTSSRTEPSRTRSRIGWLPAARGRPGHHGHERGAVTGQATVVDVAGGLVHAGLAAELGRYRLHRQAVGL